MRTSVIIAAAGKGTRLKSQLPKQFIEMNGKPMLTYSLDVFEICGFINEVIVAACDMDYLEEYIIKRFNYKKIRAVLGGETRQDSVYAGLLAVSKGTDIVLVHDGARPFVTYDDILLVTNAARLYGSGALGVRVKDTIKICGSDNRILQTLDRDALWAMQTPQGFRYELIMRAHESAQADGYMGTDDVSLAERLGYSPYVAQGSYKNFKITTAEDLAFAEWLLSGKGSYETD